MTIIEEILNLLENLDLPVTGGRYDSKESNCAAVFYTGKEDPIYALGSPRFVIERETIQIKIRGENYFLLEKQALEIKKRLLKSNSNMQIKQIGGLVDLGVDIENRFQIALNFKLFLQTSY